jgi:hypothetical protein
LRISEVKAAAEVLSMLEDQAYVTWIPEDGRDIIYGQCQPLEWATDEFDPKRLRIKIVTNRGFTLTFSFKQAMHKLQKELFQRYDWRLTKPVQLG